MDAKKAKYYDVSEHFKKILTFNQGSSVSSIAASCKLLELFNADESEEFRRVAVSAGLVPHLVGILNIPENSTAKSLLLEKDPSSESSSPTSANGPTSLPRLPMQTLITLRCIHGFCSLRHYQHKKFVDEDFLRCLMKFLSPKMRASVENVGIYYQFNPDFTTALNDTISSNGFEMKASLDWDKRVDVEEELKFYEPKLAKLKHVQQKSKSVLRVELRSSNGLSVNEHLVAQNLAWEECPDVDPDTPPEMNLKEDCAKSPDASKMTDAKWWNCWITKVLNGSLMWCLLGTDAIKAAESLKITLESLRTSLQKVAPNEDDMVIVEMPTATSTELVRGRVVNLGGGVISVFLVDSGILANVPVRAVHGIPAHLSVDEIPAMATLVKLKGVVPMPIRIEAAELAADCLMKVCRHSVAYCNHLLPVGFLDQLPDLILSPDLAVTSLVVCLAAGLVAGRKRVVCNKWLKVIYATLVRLHRCIQERSSMSRESSPRGTPEPNASSHLKGQLKLNKKENEQLVLHCLMLLVNRLYMSKSAKKYFFDAQGLELIVNVFAQYDSTEIHEMASKLMNNFVHITKNVEKEAGTPAKLQPVEGKQSLKEMRDRDRAEDSSVTGMGHEDDQDQVGDCDDADVRCREMGEDGETKQKGLRWYEDDSYLDVRSDGSHEFYQLSGYSGVAEMAATICGMLNTGHEGCVYLGISESGQVKGESLNHDQRDELRLAVDTLMMSKICPTVLHLQFQVRCIPIVRFVGSGAERQRVHWESKFVVEITFTPVPKLIYCCNNDQCFYRTGSNTLPLSQQDVRQMIVIEEESWHRSRILELRRELEERKRVLKALCTSDPMEEIKEQEEVEGEAGEQEEQPTKIKNVG